MSNDHEDILDVEEIWTSSHVMTIDRIDLSIKNILKYLGSSREVSLVGINKNRPDHCDENFRKCTPNVTKNMNYYQISVSEHYLNKLLCCSRLFVKLSAAAWTINVDSKFYSFNKLSGHDKFIDLIERTNYFNREEFNDGEVFLAQRIYHYMVAYILIHELVHAVHGNIEFKNSTHFRDAPDQVRRSYNRAMEMDADAIAFQLMMARFTSAEMIENRSALPMIIIGMLLTYFVECSVLSPWSDEGSHPHIKTRIQHIFGLLQTYQEKDGFIYNRVGVDYDTFVDDIVMKMTDFSEKIFGSKIEILSHEDSARSMFALNSYEIIWAEIYPHLQKFSEPGLLAVPKKVGPVPKHSEYLLTDTQKSIFCNRQINSAEDDIHAVKYANTVKI